MPKTRNLTPGRFANDHVLHVPCPTCNAPIGQDCRTGTGRPVNGWRLYTSDGTEGAYQRWRGTHSLRDNAARLHEG